MGFESFFKKNDTVASYPKEELKVFLQLKGLPADRVYRADAEAHVAILNDCIQRVKKTADQLQSIDAKMLPAFAVGVIALTCSFIPFNWIITLAGFSYGFYQYGLRDSVHKEYSAALDDLRQCCNWTLNGTNTDNALANLKTEPVNNVLSALAPLMSKEALKTVLHDGIEDRILTDLKIDFDKQQHSFEYKMYGHKQGGILDILVGVGYALQNAFNSAVNKYRTPETIVSTSL